MSVSSCGLRGPAGARRFGRVVRLKFDCVGRVVVLDAAARPVPGMGDVITSVDNPGRRVEAASSASMW